MRLHYTSVIKYFIKYFEFLFNRVSSFNFIINGNNLYKVEFNTNNFCISVHYFIIHSKLSTLCTIFTCILNKFSMQNDL